MVLPASHPWRHVHATRPASIAAHSAVPHDDGQYWACRHCVQYLPPRVIDGSHYACLSLHVIIHMSSVVSKALGNPSELRHLHEWRVCTNVHNNMCVSDARKCPAGRWSGGHVLCVRLSNSCSRVRVDKVTRTVCFCFVFTIIEIYFNRLWHWLTHPETLHIIFLWMHHTHTPSRDPCI